VLLVAVGGVLLGVFGLWLVHLGHFGYGSGWVDAAIVLYILVLALGGIGGQRPKQARRLASQLASGGSPASDKLRAILDDLRRARGELRVARIGAGDPGSDGRPVRDSGSTGRV
jgi:hypothetical protein